MYDPYTMDRFRFQQEKREQRVADPRPSRARALASRSLARAEQRFRSAQPATD